jgi:hypothetical protein
MPHIEEVIKGTKPHAFFMTVLGDEFQGYFKNIALPHFKSYCEKHGIGLLIVKDYLDEEKRSVHPYSVRPNLQRLLIPEAIQSEFSRYEYICDMDVDCIPSPMARDIFSFPEEGLRGDTIYITRPTPNEIPREELGRRISLLRKSFYDKTFPLDSLLTGSSEFEKETFGLEFSGPIATIGTCLGSTDLISRCYRTCYEAVGNNFNGYLQHFTNELFRKEAEINWLPYEFQAIWSYEVAMYYPFLYNEKMKDLAYECIMASLARVDMLHFAGSWPENSAFKEGPFIDPASLGEYYERLPALLEEEYTPKSYGKLKCK